MAGETKISGEAASSQSRRLDVQGLRGVAVLLVVIFHSELGLPGGFIGVDVFFVISGYVITAMLLRALGGTGSVSLSTFYARRARRLLPLLATTLLATCVLSLLLLGVGTPVQLTTRTGAAAALFSANNYLGRLSTGYFATEATDNALLHTWSLSAEEQFYFVVPGLLLLAWHLGRRTARSTAYLTRAVLVGILVSFAIAALTGDGGGSGAVEAIGFSSPESFMFFAAPSRAWEFLVGAAIALAEPKLARMSSLIRATLGLIGATAIAFAAATLGGTTSFDAWQAALVVAGTALVLLPGISSSSGEPAWMASRALSWRPLTWIGDRSYAWYLTHWPVIAFTATFSTSPIVLGAAALAALGLAAAAHIHVENRFRFDDGLSGRRALGLVSVCVVVPAMTAGAVAVADRSLQVQALQAASRQHFVYLDVCPGHAKAGDDFAVCRRSRPDATGSVFLVGDSHAAHWAEAVDLATDELGLDLTIATNSSCAMLVGLQSHRDGEHLARCDESVDSTYQLIAEERPDLVLIGSASTLYVNESARSFSTTEEPAVIVRDRARKAELWNAAMARTIEQLEALGIRTLVIHDNPYPTVDPTECSRLRLMINECEASRSLADAISYRQPAFNSEQAAVTGADSATAFDPMPFLCDEESCPNTRDGTWLYRDEHHVSVYTSTSLGGSFRDAIAIALTIAQ